jgi:hypothetical protein
MLHHAPMAASTGRTAAMRVGVERRIWAVPANTAVVTESPVGASVGPYPTEVLVAIVPFL